MMSADIGALVIERHGRRVVLARLGEQERYDALLAFGVRAAVAAAVMRGLITIARVRAI